MMARFLLGVDVGGSKTEACLLEWSPITQSGFHPVWLGPSASSFRVLFRERIPTLRDRGYDDVLSRIAGLIQSALKGLPPGAELSVAGLGLPGTVDPKTKRMTNGNSSIFVGRDLQTDFESLIPNSPVILANDANCFAFAESVAGAGVDHAHGEGRKPQDLLSVGVILGTGCGTGLVYRGEIIEGRMGGAGEAGHTTLVEGGRECFCGRRGCAELYISGTGLQLAYEEKSKGLKLPAKEIVRNMKSDPIAHQVMVEYCAYLAKFLATLVNILDPDYFVLGGGMSQVGFVYQGLESSVKGDLFLPVESPRIYQNRLGDSAGSLGAALWAQRQMALWDRRLRSVDV